jgi:hypothetical protein
MLPHTHVNWRPYESVCHLLSTYIDDCLDSYTCRLPLIYFMVVEWYYPDRVRRQFSLFQSVSPLLLKVFYHIYFSQYRLRLLCRPDCNVSIGSWSRLISSLREDPPSEDCIFYVGIQQSRESMVSQSVEVSDNHTCSAVSAIVGHLECVVYSEL